MSAHNIHMLGRRALGCLQQKRSLPDCTGETSTCLGSRCVVSLPSPQDKAKEGATYGAPFAIGWTKNQGLTFEACFLI